MVIPNNLSTRNDIDTDNVIKKRTLPVLYIVFWSNTGKVCLRVRYGDPAFAVLVLVTYLLKNYITGMGSVTGTIKGITGNVILRVW